MTRTSMLTRAAAALIAVAAIIGLGTTVSAHPTALTHALVTINRDGTFDVTFTTIGTALATKLEALGELRPSEKLDGATVGQRIVELREILTAHMTVSLDGVRVPLRFVEVTPVADETGKIAVRLSGPKRSDATRLTWTTDLVAGTYPFAVRRAGASAPTADDEFEWLTGDGVSRDYDLSSFEPVNRARRFLQSIAIGFTHIVPHGLDHILFVLGLFLLAARTRTVLVQVTSFTIAHSVTLALSLYGVVSLPASVVEPLIALSIVYIAIENFWTSTLTPWRLGLVFAFGLLHGLGFAEALMALDLPRAEFLSTLVAFNIGVEAGQLTVILAAATAVLALRIPSTHYRRLVVRPASLAIALTGAYWMVERLV